MRSWSPTACAAISELASCSAELRSVPSTAVTVSPAASPADSAALPATTPVTVTPEPVER